MLSSIEGQESRGTVKIPGKRQWRERAAQRFQADILLCADTWCVNAKSATMAFMTLDALKGRPLALTARGVDSELAVQSLTKIFQIA